MPSAAGIFRLWQGKCIASGRGSSPVEVRLESSFLTGIFMKREGWQKLVAGWPWFQREGTFPISANSEFMNPLRVVRKPYGCWDPIMPRQDDVFGWPVSEYEEAVTLRPGLQAIARQILKKLMQLAHGDPEHGIADEILRENPCWPTELQRRTNWHHERF